MSFWVGTCFSMYHRLPVCLWTNHLMYLSSLYIKKVIKMLHSGKLTPGAEDLVLGCAAVAAAFPLCPMGFLSKLPILFRQHVLSSGPCSPRLDTPASQSHKENCTQSVTPEMTNSSINAGLCDGNRQSWMG